MSSTPAAPGRFLSTWSQIHLAPSASTVIARASLMPSRAAARRHCGPRASLVRIAGRRDPGRRGRQPLVVPGVEVGDRLARARRLAKIDSRISRQPRGRVDPGPVGLELDVPLGLAERRRRPRGRRAARRASRRRGGRRPCGRCCRRRPARPARGAAGRPARTTARPRPGRAGAGRAG